MMVSWWLACGIAAAAGVAFFFLGRRAAPKSPLPRWQEINRELGFLNHQAALLHDEREKIIRICPHVALPRVRAGRVDVCNDCGYVQHGTWRPPAAPDETDDDIAP